MVDQTENWLTQLICSTKAGSVVAAAGCGKTEQIVKATACGIDRRLILTHTHAGVDALRKRLNEKGVSSKLYAIDTIAGWCLRYTASYPERSGLTNQEPRSTQDWSTVYSAAVKLIESGAVRRVLQASYCGVFVDEYQDCGLSQHEVIVAISSVLPVCVFGDPMQAIFDFKGQTPVDWRTEVFPNFPLLHELKTPHRWQKHGNASMAEWLKKARIALEAGQQLDFRQSPDCVTWQWLPDHAGPRQNMIAKTCVKAMNLTGALVIIADPKNINARALIAKKLAKQKFSNIEPVECKEAVETAQKLMVDAGDMRFQAILNFLGRCMSGIESTAFNKAVGSRATGGKLGTAKFGALVDLGLSLRNGAGDEMCLALIDGFVQRSTTYVFRRELVSVMRSALKMKIAGEYTDLSDAVWHVQNRVRHAGRQIAHRSVGSTLLVKGLEFSNAIIIHSPSMNAKDWYVAMTRATHSLTILSSQERFTPPT